MFSRKPVLAILLITASVAGLIFSGALVFEFHGITFTAADAVCSKGSGINACTVVSSSRFAVIKGVPLIKEFPVAAGGFLFYGFILIWLISGLLKKESGRTGFIMFYIALLSGLALVINFILYLISVFIIKFVCPLCLITYISTIVILGASLLYYMLIKKTKGYTIMTTKNFLKSNISILVFSLIISFSASAGINEGARLMARNSETVSYEDRLDRAVRLYERAEKINISSKDTPFLGKKDAAVILTVFFDYTCSHCRGEVFFLEELVKKYPDQVGVVFKFLPLNGDCGSLAGGRNNNYSDACIGAAGALCAYRQNSFMEFTRDIFNLYHDKNQKITDEAVLKSAEKLKLDKSSFEKCFNSDEVKKFITGEYRESERLGIGSTPTLYMNGRLLTAGSRRKDIVEGLVQYSIKRDK